MKKQCLIPVLLIMAAPVFSQQKFMFKGRLTDIHLPTKVFLSYRDNDATVRDSAISKNGEFKFSGNVREPAKAYLEVKPIQPAASGRKASYDGQELFLEEGTIQMTGKNATTATIAGGVAQGDLNKLHKILRPFKDEAAKVMKNFQGGNADTTGRSVFMAKYNVVNQQSLKAEDDFILANPDSYVSLSLLQSRANYIQPAVFGPLYNSLSSSIKNSEGGKSLALRLDIARKTSIGNQAIDFTQNTLDEKSFTLSSLRGKYVLIDFWASWCGPCRGENPYVLATYKKFRHKNFEVVGVSLDEKKEPWIKAIAKDSLPWIHVSDLKGWMNDVAVSYGIRAIPRNFLLNPEGIIIAKNLRGEDLEKTLEEVIK